MSKLKVTSIVYKLIVKGKDGDWRGCNNIHSVWVWVWSKNWGKGPLVLRLGLRIQVSRLSSIFAYSLFHFLYHKLNYVVSLKALQGKLISQ